MSSADILAGLVQEDRARYAELTRIEHDRDLTPDLLGPVESLGLLRRRTSTGAALFQGLSPCAYVVRLDDGHIAHGARDLERLDLAELDRFGEQLAALTNVVASVRAKRGER